MGISDEQIKALFSQAADFERRVLNCGGQTVFGYFLDGLVSGDSIAESVYKPIAQGDWGTGAKEIVREAERGKIYNATLSVCSDLADVENTLVNGFCVILFPDGTALAFETKTGEKRGISAPEVENTIKGPKDAFVETLRTNTSLLRRHLRSANLCFWERDVGQRTGTLVAVVWLKNLTNPKYVARMKKRLSEICVDGFLSTAMVEESLSGSRRTAFPLLQFTERPDRFCRGLLDGRVGLLIDGLPVGYLLPVDIGYLMESQEDRNRDYVSASGVRFLRYCALLLSLLLPGIYIALVCFHPEMIPLPLLRSMVESKENVPFSTVTEVLTLMIAFSLLQESGIHLPQALGQAVSVIGGIVVGTAAVEAGFVSPSALIVVSAAGICNFVLPNRDLGQSVQVWELVIAVLASFLGLFGVTVGGILLLMHLSGLKSLGMDYLLPMSGDGSWHILRQRFRLDQYRNPKLHPKDLRRQK